MAAPSGISGQIGYADEVTPGVAVAPTLFLPFVDESLDDARPPLEGDSIIAGDLFLAEEQFNGGQITVGGDVSHEALTGGMAKLFKHMLGSVSTSGSGPYTHTVTPGSLTGKSFTAQVGVPDSSGTVHPKTVAGCKIASWEVAISEGEVATVGITVMGMIAEFGTRSVADGVTVDESDILTSATAAFTHADEGLTVVATGVPTGTRIAEVLSATEVRLTNAATADGTGLTVRIGLALGTASYGAGAKKPFKFGHASFKIDGDEVWVKAATISGDNGLVERRFAGDRRTKEPLESDLRVIDGSLELEFSSKATLNKFLDGAVGELEIGLRAGTASITITATVRFDPETPKVAGREILSQNLPIKAVIPAGGTNADAITVVIVNGDSAA